MIGDRTFMMVKGPSHLGVNFGLTMEHLRFLASNQTLSPSLNGKKEQCVQPRLHCKWP